MDQDRLFFRKSLRALLEGERVGFISPTGFLAMHLFQGTAWILLILFALRKGAVGSPLFFAMVHAFGLGFLTLAALSVLVHVLPAAAGLPVGKSLRDRGPIGGAILGALLFVGGWIIPDLRVALAGGVVVLLSGGYFLARVLREIAAGGGRTRPRGLGLDLMTAMALAFFVAGTLLGILMLATLLHPAFGLSLTLAPPAHALMMIGGWLALLVMSVFLRTSGPLLGRSVMSEHSVKGWILVLCGILLALPGMLMPLPLLIPPAYALGVAGLFLYGSPAGTAILKSHPINPYPLWFLRSSLAWLIAGGFLLFAFLGPLPLPLAGILMIFLVGGVGQFFLAHLYHLGPRLLSILRNGAGDLTPPAALLDKRRSVSTYLLYQAGIALVILSFLLGGRFFEGLRLAGAFLGFLAWVSLSMEIRSAWIKTGHLPKTENRILFPVTRKKS
ncbi:MAG: hypothetical protein M1313_02760 [Nitrospirae bacterium]|nr:hypothetical protein [Nitrospirota bacterium]